jgi:hypothetical protein
MVTLAFRAIIIAWNDLFLQKVRDHLEDLTIIVIGEIESEVPSVVKRDWFMLATHANHSRKQLSCKIITNHWVLSLFIIIPPIVTLHHSLLTISCKLCFDKSALNYLYFGFLDRFSSRLSVYSNAAKNSCASCCE